jgi:tetratricopeptide (TPR) repeat protein
VKKRNHFLTGFGVVMLITMVLVLGASNTPAQQTQKPDPRRAKVLAAFEQTRRTLVETSSPDDVVKDFELARRQIQSGDVDQALISLGRTMSREARKPTFRVLWASFDRIVQEYEKFDQAILFMQELVILHPNLADPRAGLAAAYGEYASAFERAQPPNLPEVIRYANLSLQHLDVALALEPDNFMARLGRGITYSYSPGGLKGAEEDFKQLLVLQVMQKHPWYPYQMVYFYYADTLKRHDKRERAAEILRLGLTYYPLDENLKKELEGISRTSARNTSK